MEFKQEFWFEKSQHTEYLAKLPMRFVWGVSAEDNGNYLEPGSKGSLVLDPTFQMASPESQVLNRVNSSCRNAVKRTNKPLEDSREWQKRSKIDKYKK